MTPNFNPSGREKVLDFLNDVRSELAKNALNDLRAELRDEELKAVEMAIDFWNRRGLNIRIIRQ